MNYVLGIDSGGTKYLIRAYSLEGKPLGMYTGDTCTHYYLGVEKAASRIAHHIDACLSSFGGKREECVYLVCGTTGIDSDEDLAIVSGIYTSLPGFRCPMRCINDAELAHFTATGGVGALIICGTGSISFGRNSKGENTRTGGWFYTMLSDEGSGSHITRMALHHLCFYFDGCVEKTPLVSLCLEELGIHTRKELLDLGMRIAVPPFKLPALGKQVNLAAADGDPYAYDILKEAAKCTFSITDSVVQKLKLYEEDSFKVGAWGSAIVKSPLHFKLFSEQFYNKYGNVLVLVPDKDAAEGACEMALALLADENAYEKP